MVKLFYNLLRNYVTILIIVRKYVNVKRKNTDLRKMEKIMLFLYDLIEELCMKNDITITTLCKECKIPRSTITDFKKGRIKTLSASTLCKIADYFDVTVDYLCGIDSEKPNEDQVKRFLFGDDFDVSDEIWEDVKKYVEFLKSRN